MKKVLILLWAMATIASAQTASVQVDANGTVLNFQSPSTKAVNFPTSKLTVNGVQITGVEFDASTTVKGVTKLSVAPVSASNPIAVGDNDSRNTNARTPTAHASTHANIGTDPVTLIISQITGLQSALDLKAPLASPTFTGVPLAPTAAVDTNTTQVATTGFVLAQAANATPIVASTGAVGTSTRYARQDHVHPAQTSVTGNAATATALQTARTINGTSFDGTANITVTAAAGTLTGTTLASGVTASSLLSASGGSFGTAAFTPSSAYAASNQGVITLSLATPNVLYATPVTFSNSSGAWTGTLSLNTQSANTFFAGPTTGSAATPTMRALVFADLPGITSANLRSMLSDELGTGAALFDGATPTAFTLTNANGLPITGITSSTSAQLRTLLSDENGTGAALFDGNTSAAFTTPKITTGINDANGNSMLAFTATASAVDGFTFTNAATANPATVTMAATGSDSNVILALGSKGNAGINFTTGTVTTSNPFSFAQTWNASGTTFTGLLVNPTSTASAASSLIVDFQVGGVSKFKIDKFGLLTTAGSQGAVISGSVQGTSFNLNGDTYLHRHAAGQFSINSTNTDGQWGSLFLGTRDSGTTTITNGLTLGHQSTGTPAAGLGEAILGNLDSNTTADQNAFRLYYKWSDATQATRTSAFGIQLVNNAAALADVLTISGAGAVAIPGSLTVTGNITATSGTSTFGLLNTTSSTNAIVGEITLTNTSTAASAAKGAGIDFFGTDTIGTNKYAGSIQFQGADQDYNGSKLNIVTRLSNATSTTATFDGSRFTSNLPIKLKSYTVATLPAGTQGDTAYVTDALTPTFLAVVVGGGSTVAPVFYNGTNWVGY